MSNLIPVFNSHIQNEQIQLVDARVLHEFLEVDTHFKDWIARRISEYEFIENQDFILIAQKRATKGRGGDRRSKDYHITLDMAKELSMIERTEKGRQARKYFIACEKALLSKQLPKIESKGNYRYHVEITITDRLFGNNRATIKTEAKNLNCMVTGFAKTLGFKINSMSIADEAFRDFCRIS